MPLGFKLNTKTFRITEVNSFGKFDGFRVGMRVTGLHFYYYKVAGSYKNMNEKRWNEFSARLKVLEKSNCRFVAVAVESSKKEHMFIHSSVDRFVNTIKRGGRDGARSTVSHSKKDATRISALWLIDMALLTRATKCTEVKCVTDVFPGLKMKHDMHMTRMKRNLNIVNHYQQRKFVLEEELKNVNDELEKWIATRKEQRDEMEYKMSKDLEILHETPLEAARMTFSDNSIIVKELDGFLKKNTGSKEDLLIARVDLKHAQEDLKRSEAEVQRRVRELEIFRNKKDSAMAKFDQASETDKVKLIDHRKDLMKAIEKMERKRRENAEKITLDQKQFEHIAYLIAHANGHDTHCSANASTGLRRYVLDSIVVPQLAETYNVPLSEACKIANKHEIKYTIRGMLSITALGKKDATIIIKKFPRC